MSSDDSETKVWSPSGAPSGPVDKQPAISIESLIGRVVDGFKLSSLVNAGAYSLVFDATSVSTPARRSIVKLALPAGVEVLSGRSADTRLATQAQTIISGGTMPLKPDRQALLEQQAAKLQSVRDSALVAVENFTPAGQFSALRLECIEGPALRRIMGRKPAPVRHIQQLAAAMTRLVANPRFQHHGDLKPENVLLSGEGIKILDPGHFGPLKLVGGFDQKAIVTTPEYYPSLRPDDLFAVGIMLWEAVCGQHPLMHGGNGEDTAGERLRNRVNNMARVGQHRLEPLLSIARPCKIRPQLPETLERVVLRAMGLQALPNGTLELDEGYGSFAELSRALEPFSSLDS